jgi:ABC-type transport system involved in multi-copper enzyme maturation permease subunit
MTAAWPTWIVVGFILCLVQFLAALPWVTVVTLGSFRVLAQRSVLWGVLPRALLGLAVATALVAVGFRNAHNNELLTTLGRFYGVFLCLQLLLDFIVLILSGLLVAWPRGGAVARAAFLEGVRQPMFWFLVIIAMVAILIMPFLEYYTFGEDIKMVKELGYDTTMLFAGLFAILAASMSISEEIEGRTAITLMSKPVSRRQFLLGKFVGILMAALLMTGLLTLTFFLILWLTPFYKREEFLPPTWLSGYFWPALGDQVNAVWGGIVWWMGESLILSTGIVLGFCQVMVLLAIAVALATRLPMVINFPICSAIYFLGHLTPVLVRVAEGSPAPVRPLVRFIAQLFDTLLPSFDFFNIGPALTRDTFPAAGPFALYIASVTGYALLYTFIALLVGLILFEDRDLA